MANFESAYNGYIDETIALDYSVLDNAELEQKIRRMNCIFNKIREIEIGLNNYDKTMEYKILSRHELLNNSDFITFYKENYALDLEILMNLQENLKYLVNKIKKNNLELISKLEDYTKKIDKLKYVLNISYDVLEYEPGENSQGEANDSFFDEYKKRLNNSINDTSENIIQITKKLNYNYNIFNIIRKFNEKEDIRLKFTCLICHTNEKDSFLDCGHTYCKLCLEKLPNLICPYCTAQSKKINKLYLN